MFRSVWDRIHYRTDPLCFHGTGTKLERYGFIWDILNKWIHLVTNSISDPHRIHQVPYKRKAYPYLDLRKSILLAPAKIHLLWKMVLSGPHGCFGVALIFHLSLAPVKETTDWILDHADGGLHWSKEWTWASLIHTSFVQVPNGFGLV